jgi:hypothetical protein
MITSMSRLDKMSVTRISGFPAASGSLVKLKYKRALNRRPTQKVIKREALSREAL